MSVLQIYDVRSFDKATVNLYQLTLFFCLQKFLVRLSIFPKISASSEAELKYIAVSEKVFWDDM